MQQLERIRAAIQAKILGQYPKLSADAIEPYCRLLCRRALALAAREAAAIAADPAVKREDDLMHVTLTEEIDALREALPEAIERIVADAADDDDQVRPAARLVMQSLINGGVGTPPLSLEAIRARVDAGTFLISQWGGRDEDLPAYAYWQHRMMVWLLAEEFDTPGMLDPYNPEHPEGKARMCEELFPVEMAALKVLVKARLRCAVQPTATQAQNMARLKAVFDTLERQFVGDQPELPADWQDPQ